MVRMRCVDAVGKITAIRPKYLTPYKKRVILRNGGSTVATNLKRTKDNPWKLKTPPGPSEFTMHVDEKDGKKFLVCTVGSAVLHYDARCIDDLHVMLRKAGDWVELGGADEQKPAKEGTVEAWGRSPDNPVGGWLGLQVTQGARASIHAGGYACSAAHRP
jgi:hypothetical protein